MPNARIAGIDLNYELMGEGDPVVCVNGGLGAIWQWMLVAPTFAESFQVAMFDQRGHGQSGGKVGEDPMQGVDDLADLIEFIGFGAAHIVTQSLGGVFALHLATRRPELVRSLSMHEPPLLGLLSGRPRSIAQELFSTTARRFRKGEFEEGLIYFFEGCGMDWSLLPQPIQDAVVENAPNYAGTWFDDLSHPFWNVDVPALSSPPAPMHLTRGALSPPLLQELADATVAAFPPIEVRVLEGGGHGAMFDQPALYIETVKSFIQ